MWIGLCTHEMLQMHATHVYQMDFTNEQNSKCTQETNSFKFEIPFASNLVALVVYDVFVDTIYWIFIA